MLSDALTHISRLGMTMSHGRAIAASTRIGWFGKTLAWLLRRSRIARGWRVDTEAAFIAAVETTARFVEAHPGLVHFWAESRVVRLQAVHAKMMEVLAAKAGRDVRIWQLVTDDRGAMGEATLGGWIAPFRIYLRPQPVEDDRR
jgi:hypothetical protein